MTIERLRDQTDIEIYRAGGPGGQHRNKTQNAVRLLHRPTGLRASASERRSLHENLEVAFERLAQKIEAQQAEARRAPRVPTRPGRSAKRRRLESKRRRGEVKRQRTRPSDDD